VLVLPRLLLLLLLLLSLPPPPLPSLLLLLPPPQLLEPLGLRFTPYVRARISPSFVLRLHVCSAATRSRLCGLRLAFVHDRLHSFVPDRLFGLRLGSFVLDRALMGFGGALCVPSSLLYQIET
jgi:hypothetical protein